VAADGPVSEDVRRANGQIEHRRGYSARASAIINEHINRATQASQNLLRRAGSRLVGDIGTGNRHWKVGLT